MTDGSPLDLSKTYRVAMPDFLAAGGDGLQPVMSTIPADRIQVFNDRPLHQVFADILRTFPQPLTPKLDGRVTILNQPKSRTQ
jgi:2',3'-cyclic-nucleotide 2'-phosphodiesterase (5'-nucleotidase family)